MREGMSKLGGCFKIQTHSQKFWGLCFIAKLKIDNF